MEGVWQQTGSPDANSSKTFTHTHTQSVPHPWLPAVRLAGNLLHKSIVGILELPWFFHFTKWSPEWRPASNPAFICLTRACVCWGVGGRVCVGVRVCVCRGVGVGVWVCVCVWVYRQLASASTLSGRSVLKLFLDLLFSLTETLWRVQAWKWSSVSHVRTSI